MSTDVSPSFGRPGTVLRYRLKRPDASVAADDAPVLPIMIPETTIYMLFAHRQWRAGMLLADAIFAGLVPVDDQWVLELGAGTGLPALAASLTRHPRKVVVTDYDDAAIVQALRTNAAACAAANPQRKMALLTVAGHSWGHRIDDVLDLLPCTPKEPSPRFGVLLLADCVWERFSHDILLKSITHLLARTQEARVYMVAGLHTGRSTLVQFFRRALEAGLQLVPLPHLDQWPKLSAEESTGDSLLPGSEHVLEMEVGGDWDSTGSSSQGGPCLTGARRAFLTARPTATADDETIQQRNHWLTVSSMAWAATT
ncbi:nicotinamide N-methyltransferase [Malassezia caprae]|uniref:Nicotinamide N-methyltransferase n=1 Tax=Malassezia caprae TaxID=1381934 RepID=A0AAF0IUL4_9BASI|nr:nicotinamide N-methyltransferase [Malassezia caprae]